MLLWSSLYFNSSLASGFLNNWLWIPWEASSKNPAPHQKHPSITILPIADHRSPQPLSTNTTVTDIANQPHHHLSPLTIQQNYLPQTGADIHSCRRWQGLVGRTGKGSKKYPKKGGLKKSTPESPNCWSIILPQKRCRQDWEGLNQWMQCWLIGPHPFPPDISRFHNTHIRSFNRKTKNPFCFHETL